MVDFVFSCLELGLSSMDPLLCERLVFLLSLYDGGCLTDPAEVN